MKSLQIPAMAMAAVLAAGLSSADEGKDESGKGGQYREERSHRSYGAGDSYFHERGYTRLDISKGHYPSPGECRVWYPDRPPGQQPPPVRCGSGAPAGAWLIEHPQDLPPDHVQVTVYEPHRPGVVRAVGEFDIGSGLLVRVVLEK